MKTTTSSAREIAFEAVMAEAALQVRDGDPRAALTMLRDAHILGQQDLGRHWKTHWRMLLAGCALCDAREVAGQVIRLLLVPLGHLSGRLPVGNPGTADVDAFTPHPIPPRLQRLLDGDA